MDNADQKAQFDNELAKAALDASDQKAVFDNRLAKAAHDASDQKALFDNQLAKVNLDASDQKVCGLFAVQWMILITNQNACMHRLHLTS